MAAPELQQCAGTFLRQQLLALHAKRSRRRLSVVHRLYWVMLSRLWSGWKGPLILVTLRTVVDWHRAGFRLYWKWLSRVRRVGGKRVSEEIRALIFRMVAENPTWGAPRIHGELLKLGFDLSEATVSRVGPESPAKSRSGQALAYISQKPPRSNCGNGLLHCSDTDVRCSVLLFCHRPRASRFLVSSLLPCGNHRGARYVSRPPITVNTTRAFRIRSGG